jgi:NADPH:quinone reductase-like Zn-dependent oxidoreductase
MGLVQLKSDGLGCEGSGIVRQVGPDVTDLNVGDRVLIFCDHSFSTRLITSSKLCAKMADDLSFEDAATMPCVYATVIYSLIDMARLEKAQVSASL